MSCHEEERGTYTLPAKEVVGLHKALREHTNDRHERVRQEVYAIHQRAGGTRSVKKYLEALTALGIRPLYSGDGKHLLNLHCELDSDRIQEDALEIIADMLAEAHSGNKGVHKPTLAEIERVAPKVNNRTQTFRVGDEGCISFHGREVTWDIGCNNHNVEQAHDSGIAKVFFGYLDGIRWTRNSGGYCLYGNEYSRELGGGGDAVTNRYGPLGEAGRVIC